MKDSKSYDGLMLLRGGMVIFVHLYHSLAYFNLAFKINQDTSLMYQYTITIVQAFFMVSGFLIFERYFVHYIQYCQPRKRFYLSRFTRIYPLWIFTATYIYFHRTSLLDSSKLEFEHLFGNIFLYFGFLEVWDPLYSYTFIGWSVFVEVFFYLVFPVIAFKLYSNKTNSLMLFLLLMLLSIAIQETYPHLLNSFFLFNLNAIVLGIMIHQNLESLIRLKEKSYCFLGMLLLGMVGFLSCPFVPYITRPLLFLPLVIFFILYCPKRDFWTSHLFKTGKYCYGIYLNTYLVMSMSIYLYFRILKTHLPEFDNSILKVIYLPLVYILTYFISKISYHYFELPFRKYIERRFKFELKPHI